MSTSCAIPLTTLRGSITAKIQAELSKLRKRQLEAQKQLMHTQAEIKAYSPKKVLPAILFDTPELEPLTTHAIQLVKRNIADALHELKHTISTSKEARIRAKEALKATATDVTDITLENATCLHRGDNFFIRVAAPTITSAGVTLPEGDIVITLTVRVVGLTQGIIRIEGKSEYQVARHLRDSYRHHAIPIYAENHGVNKFAEYPINGLQPEVQRLLAKLQDTSVNTFRLDNILSTEEMLDFAGGGDTDTKTNNTKRTIFEIKRPVDMGGGRLVAQAQPAPTPEIDPETGRAYSPIERTVQWAIIPHGHRIPRGVSMSQAHKYIIEMAVQGISGAQHAFDAYVKNRGVHRLTRTIAMTDETLVWLHAQYPQVAVADDGTGGQAPTIG